MLNENEDVSFLTSSIYSEFRTDSSPSFSLFISSWSLFLVSWVQIIITLSRTAISTFYGYGDEATVNNPNYSMKLYFGMNGDNNKYENYWTIQQTMLIPSLLFFGPFASKWNLKVTLGVCTIINSVAILLHAYSTQMWHLYLLSGVIGLVQGVCSAIPYMLPTLYFQKKQQIKAYNVFSMIIQLADSFKFLLSNMIALTGWKNAWLVMGINGTIIGLLLIFTTPNVA